MNAPLVRWEDLTAAWFQTSLALEVTPARVVLEPLGEGRSNLAGIVRARLEGPDGALLRSVVVKLAPSNVSSLVRSWRLGRRETLYYEHLADNGPMRAPRCFHTARDDRSGDFTLVLEDLGAAATGDQGVGATAEQATIAVDALAKLHAFHWESPTLEAHADWLLFPNANREAFAFFVQRAWKTCAEKYPDLPTSTPQALEALRTSYGPLLDRMSTPPVTLLHGDFRLDNMFFRSEAWPEDFAACDWQLVGRGRGGWDLGHFLAGSLTPSLRAELAGPLLQRYHAALAAKAPAGWTLEACRADYDAALVGSFGIAAVLVDMQMRSGGMPHPVMETWLRRSSQAASETLAKEGGGA